MTILFNPLKSTFITTTCNLNVLHHPTDYPSRPISTCSTLQPLDDDSWQLDFLQLLESLTRCSAVLESIRLESFKIECQFRDLCLLEQALMAHYDLQEHLYLDCLGASDREQIQTSRLGLSLMMGGSAGMGQVVHSFENPDRLLEYIVSGSGITLESFNHSWFEPNLKHIQLHQHQFILYINQQERKRFKLISKTQWTPDGFSNHCQINSCFVEFGFFNRRHHCRRCGILVCQKHSLNKLPLFTNKKDTISRWYRVCDTCFYDLIVIKKPTDSATHLSEL